MVHAKDRFQPATGGSRYEWADIPQTGKPARAHTAGQANVLLQEIADLHARADALARDSNASDLEQRQQLIMRELPSTEALTALSEYGFAWRDIARVVGVSVPAITKWRRGAGTTPENRAKIAKLLALLQILELKMVNEPASWLEMPLREGVAASRLDLLAAGRYDLVIDLASSPDLDTAITKALDGYDEDWRTTLVDDTFETFLADDGVVSIRPRGATA